MVRCCRMGATAPATAPSSCTRWPHAGRCPRGHHKLLMVFASFDQREPFFHTHAKGALSHASRPPDGVHVPILAGDEDRGGAVVHGREHRRVGVDEQPGQVCSPVLPRGSVGWGARGGAVRHTSGKVTLASRLHRICIASASHLHRICIASASQPVKHSAGGKSALLIAE